MSTEQLGSTRWPSAGWVIRSTALVVLTVALLQAVANIASVLVLIIIGGFVAVGIEPVVSRFEQRGWRRGWVILAFALSLLAAIAAVALLIAVPLANQLSRLIDATPEVVADVAETLGDSQAAERLKEPEAQATAKNLVSTAVSHLDGLFGSLFDAVGGLLGFLVSASTVAAVAVYASLALPRLRDNARHLLGNRERAGVLDEALSKVGAFVSGQALLCLSAGAISFVVFLVLGVPYPGVLAILVMCLDAIPQIGAFLGAVIAVAVSVTDSIETALAVAIFFMIYQVIENNLIAPRVFSHVIQLTPLVTFVAILIGAGLAGILGAVAALPVTASLVVVGRHVMGARAVQDGAAPPSPVAHT